MLARGRLKRAGFISETFHPSCQLSLGLNISVDDQSARFENNEVWRKDGRDGA